VSQMEPNRESVAANNNSNNDLFVIVLLHFSGAVIFSWYLVLFEDFFILLQVNDYHSTLPYDLLTLHPEILTP
jgi:hypothetical protein